MTRLLAPKDIEVRWATPEDAETLATLVETRELPVDWAHPLATRGWLLAEYKGDVLGCTQVLIGHPIGQLERQHVKPGLSAREAHAVMAELTRVGLFSLQQVGAQVAAAFVDFHDKGMKRMVKKRYGGVATAQGNLMVASLVEG